MPTEAEANRAVPHSLLPQPQTWPMGGMKGEKWGIKWNAVQVPGMRQLVKKGRDVLFSYVFFSEY